MRFHAGGSKRAIRGARKPLLAAVIAGAALCSPLVASAQPPQAVLKPGEVFGTTVTGPNFGASRQGGCSEINSVTDPTFGQMIEIKVADDDHLQPGRNPGTWPDGTSWPLGGCYAVHHRGGVAAGLSGPTTLQPYHEYFISFGLDIPSAQPGLASGAFPSKLPGFFGAFETLGGVTGSPDVWVGLANNPETGQLQLESGFVNRTTAFWQSAPFAFDKLHNIVVDYVLSPCGVNGNTQTKPAASTPCAPGQIPGRLSVSDNGVPLLNNYGTGTAVSTLPTEEWAAAQFPFLFQYRSTGTATRIPASGAGPGAWGGTTLTLNTGIKVGTTLASVQ